MAGTRALGPVGVGARRRRQGRPRGRRGSGAQNARAWPFLLSRLGPEAGFLSLQYFTGGQRGRGGHRGRERWSGRQRPDPRPWAALVFPSVKWENGACLTGGPRTPRGPQQMMTCESNAAVSPLPHAGPAGATENLVWGPELVAGKGSRPHVTSEGWRFLVLETWVCCPHTLAPRNVSLA